MSKPRKARARQSFTAGTATGDRMITGGTILDADDPIVLAFPDMFEALVEVIAEPMPPAKKAAPSKRPPAAKGRADG